MRDGERPAETPPSSVAPADCVPAGVSALVEVELCGGRPVRVRWQGRWRRVEAVAEAWAIEGRWWGGEERRLYLRLVTTAGTLEVWRRGEAGGAALGGGAAVGDGVSAWVLDRILD
jgi:hypothetical protein